jgi:hypothetical protein
MQVAKALFFMTLALSSALTPMALTLMAMAGVISFGLAVCGQLAFVGVAVMAGNAAFNAAESI